MFFIKTQIMLFYSIYLHLLITCKGTQVYVCMDIQDQWILIYTVFFSMYHKEVQNMIYTMMYIVDF